MKRRVRLSIDVQAPLGIPDPTEGMTPEQREEFEEAMRFDAMPRD